MHLLPQLAPNFVKDQFTKLRWFSSREEIGEEAKIIFKLLFLTRKHALTNNQRVLSNSENFSILIQGTLVGRDCPKMGERSICETSAAGSKVHCQRNKNNFNVSLSDLKASFPKKTKGHYQKKKTLKMS